MNGRGRIGAGRLNCVLTLQSPSETTNTTGETVETWTTVDASVRANIAPQGGGEFSDTAQVQGERTHKVTILWRSDVTTKSRFLFGNRTFYVESILPNEEYRHEIVMLCRERL